MGFSALLGNDQLHTRLQAAFAGGTVSHSWMLCGPEGSGKHTLAVLMAAAMECTAGSDVPCGVCSQCRKVFAGIHPDVITVDTDKKYIPVEQIRTAVTDICIRPNEGKKKIYIVPRAQDLLEPAQNALLKMMEEPPSYGVFLLLTTSQNKLLPTIRSRCAVLHMQPLPQDLLERELESRLPGHTAEERAQAVSRSAGYLGQALELLKNGTGYSPETEAFVQAWAGKDPVALLKLLVSMEKLERNQLAALLQQWLELLSDALVGKSGGKMRSAQAGKIGQTRTGREIRSAAASVQQALIWCSANVGTAHVCGALAVQLQNA